MADDVRNPVGLSLLKMWRQGNGSPDAAADEPTDLDVAAVEGIDEWGAEAWVHHVDAMRYARNDAEADLYAWQRVYYYLLFAQDFWDDGGFQIADEIARASVGDKRLGNFICEWILLEHSGQHPGLSVLLVETLNLSLGWCFGEHLVEVRRSSVEPGEPTDSPGSSAARGMPRPSDIWWAYAPSGATAKCRGGAARLWRESIERIGAQSEAASLPSHASSADVMLREREGASELWLIAESNIVAALDSGVDTLLHDPALKVSLHSLVTSVSPGAILPLTRTIEILIEQSLDNADGLSQECAPPWMATKSWRNSPCVDI